MLLTTAQNKNTRNKYKEQTTSFLRNTKLLSKKNIKSRARLPVSATEAKLSMKPTFDEGKKEKTHLYDNLQTLVQFPESDSQASAPANKLTTNSSIPGGRYARFVLAIDGGGSALKWWP